MLGVAATVHIATASWLLAIYSGIMGSKYGSGVTRISWWTCNCLSLNSRYVPSALSSMLTKFPRCQGRPSSKSKGARFPMYKLAYVMTDPHVSGTSGTNPCKTPSPPFASPMTTFLVMSIGRTKACCHTFRCAMFSWDPVSTIAVIGAPSHSNRNFISCPLVRDGNIVAAMHLAPSNSISSSASTRLAAHLSGLFSLSADLVVVEDFGRMTS